MKIKLKNITQIVQVNHRLLSFTIGKKIVNYRWVDKVKIVVRICDKIVEQLTWLRIKKEDYNIRTMNDVR